MATAAGPVADVPWGLMEFFSEISRFLLTLERQYGIANQAFTEYAVIRIAVCSRGVSGSGRGSVRFDRVFKQSSSFPQCPKLIVCPVGAV